MNVSTCDRAVLAHAAEVVAPEVDEHHVLGALLLVGQQALGDRARPRRRRRRAGACRRSGRVETWRPVTVSSGSGLAPATWKSQEVQEVHVRARVDDAQPAVDRERVDVELGADQRCDGHDLEGVAGVDVLDDPRDHRLELPRAACSTRTSGRARGRRRRRRPGSGPGEQRARLARSSRARRRRRRRASAPSSA